MFRRNKERLLNVGDTKHLERKGPGVGVEKLRKELESLMQWEAGNGYHLLKQEDPPVRPSVYWFGDIYYNQNPLSTVSFFQEGVCHVIKIPKDPTQDTECYAIYQEIERPKGLRGVLSGNKNLRKKKDISFSEWVEEYQERIETQRKLAESRSKELGIASEAIGGLKR